jgi:hypothetical protein
MGELAKVHKELKFTWVCSNTKYLTLQIVQLR